MNYIVNNPSALVQNRNLTLSPFYLSEYNQFSTFTPQIGEKEFIGNEVLVNAINERRIAKNQEIIKELTEDKFQAVDEQLAASKLSQEQMSKKFKEQKELLIVGGSIILVILILLFLGKK
jgi:hypothetical protein